MKDIKEMYIDKKMQRKDVAFSLGISEYSLIKILYDNGIKKRKNHKDFPPLTTNQLDFINGSLLGDAYCAVGHTRINSNAVFSKTQSKIPRGKVQGKVYLNRKEYIDYHYEIMGEYSSRISLKNSITPQGKMIEVYEYATKSHPCFTEIYKNWYIKKNGKNIKIVPQNLKLNPYVLSIWFCDDGINKYKDKVAVFCTDCFTKEENYFLLDLIYKCIGIKGHLCKDNRIHIGNKEGYLDFLNIIKPHIIWDCFKYKINTEYYSPVKIAENHYKTNLTNDEVLNIAMLHNNGIKNIEIAKKYNVSKTTIGNIIKRKIWKSLDLNINKNISFNSSGIKGIYKTKNNKYYLKLKNKVFNTLEEAIQAKRI